MFCCDLQCQIFLAVFSDTKANKVLLAEEFSICLVAVEESMGHCLGHCPFTRIRWPENKMHLITPHAEL